MSEMVQTWITGSVAVVVSFAWLAALGIGYLQKDWTPLITITPIMGILVGYATGVKIIKGKNGNG